MLYKPISAMQLRSNSNTNIETIQITEVKPLVLLDWPIFMKFGMHYVMPYEAIPMVYTILVLINNANTSLSDSEIMPLILLECQNPSSWDFVMYIMPPEAISTAYLGNPSPYQFQHYNLSNCRDSYLKITWPPKPVMKFDMNVMPSETIIVVHLINESH
jgi:hypothetical protein